MPPGSKKRSIGIMHGSLDIRQRSRRNTSCFSTQKPITTFNKRKCMAWFKEYSTIHDPDTFGPDGMKKFCVDINIRSDNIVMLVLAHKMEARQMGSFSNNEWLKGLEELQCDSAKKLRAKLAYLKKSLNDLETFKNVYRYAFDFARDNHERSMRLDMATTMLNILLEEQWKLLPDFLKFLHESNYKLINRDQWNNILEFARTVNFDLSNYDVDGAWPVMLDEFVEWCKKKNEPTTTFRGLSSI